MRAKFIVQSVKDFGNNYQEVEMTAVYSDKNNKEDNQFSAATPNGKLTMTISNPEVVGFLKPRAKYYLDFTEAPE